MLKIIRTIIICWTVFVLSSSMAFATTFEHLYGIKIKNKDEIHLNLLNSYINNSATRMSSTYLYTNEDRYYLAYLAAINNSYAYYYYLSNVNDLKHNEFLKYLDILGYQYSEIKSDTYINLYRNNALRQNLFDGKLQAIKNNKLSEFVAQQNNTTDVQYSTTNNVSTGYTSNQSYPTYQSLSIPAGYTIKLFTTTAIALCSITSNQPYTTILANDIVINGKIVIPRGSTVEGILRPHLFTDYNNNYIEVTFNKITTPSGKTYNIRTENLSIYKDIKTQYEYTYNNIMYGSTNNTTRTNNTASTNSSSSNKMTTGQKVVVGAAAVGIAALIVGGIILASKDSSTTSTTNSGSTTTTSTTPYRVYRAPKTPEELCPNHNVRIEANSVFDIILTVPVLL